MANVPLVQIWGESQDTSIQFDVDGRIMDFLEPGKRRKDEKEERVRQQYAQTLHFEYGYPRECMLFEAPIQIGHGRKPADIAVYSSPAARAARDQAKILLIVETKAPTKQEGKAQLSSYLFPTSAEGGVWTNGDLNAFFRRQQEPQELLEWSGIPRFGEPWDAVGRCAKSALIKPYNLQPVFRQCHNALYRTGMSSEDVAMDMVRILLAKLTDEVNPGDYCEFRCTPGELRNAAGRQSVARRVKALFDQVKWQHRNVFCDLEEINAGDDAMAAVVSQLQPFSFLEAPCDVLGTAFEVYVASHLKGERGQYFTNRSVINLIIGILDPSERDVIFDPAVGSGGFLISALSYVTNKILRSRRSPAARAAAIASVGHNLYGIEKAPRLVRVAKANLLLSRDGYMGIVRGDSLLAPESLPREFLEKAGPGTPSVVLTNPPFGSGSEVRITEPTYLENFDLGHAWELDVMTGKITMDPSRVNASGVAPELLFLERCIRWAAPGGRIGIMMARGQLDNKEATAARRYVLDRTRLLAVINCHEDTFKPFVGSKASLLFLQKKSPGEDDDQDYKIFMAISKRVGQNSRGQPIPKRDANGNLILRNGQPILDHDLNEILEAYRAWKNNRMHSFAFGFEARRSQIAPPLYSLNPVKFLPHFNESLAEVIRLGDLPAWELRRLGEIAVVFNGPRFRRPYADEGRTDGPGIYRYYTGTAMTQSKGENLKYLDVNKADATTRKCLEKLKIKEGWILITDSGTLGRVIYARKEHQGSVATNNLIRVVIADAILRGYVYQFLQSRHGQDQLLMGTYGTNQNHIEPEHVAEVLIPIPKDRSLLEEIGRKALESVQHLEESRDASTMAAMSLEHLLHNKCFRACTGPVFDHTAKTTKSSFSHRPLSGQ